MKIHQKISKPDYQKLKTMVKRNIDQKLRLRTFDAKNERIETGAVVTSRAGDWVVLKEDKEFAISGKQKGSVREETNAVSGTTVVSVQNRHQKTAPPSEPTSERPTQIGRSASRKKSFRGWSPSTAVQRLPERYLHQVTQ